jgi:hypothetical protein
MASTFLAAATPTIWSFFAPNLLDVFYLAAWLAFSVICLVIGAAVSFLVLWPTALILEDRPPVRATGIVLAGTLAWPGVMALTLWLITGDFDTDDVLEMSLIGALVGLASSSLFAFIAGFPPLLPHGRRKHARAQPAPDA